MRTILAIAGLLLCPLSFAQGIPSAASGLYLTPDRVCRVVFSRFQVSWLLAEMTCMEWSGAVKSSSQTVYAPQAGSCWPAGSAVAFNSQAPIDYVSFVHYFDADAGALGALVGNQAQVVNGDGEGQKWVRVATLESPAPFTCAGPEPAAQSTPHYPRLCRQYGLYCGG